MAVDDGGGHAVHRLRRDGDHRRWPVRAVRPGAHHGFDRTVLDVPGVAGVTDRGRLRGRNEDALAVGRLDRDGTGVTMAVVCDGVSTSPQGDLAARAAVDAAIVVLLDLLDRGHGVGHATEAGARRRGRRGRRAARRPSAAVPPSCTYVSAIVTGAEVTIGWVGDSRAYWLDADGATALTVDDSPAAQLAATGIPVPGVDPHSVALLRWLGADAPDGPPHVVTFRPPGPGRLLLCSDGLSRYAKEPADLAVAVRVAAGRGDAPDAAALALTEFALEAGEAGTTSRSPCCRSRRRQRPRQEADMTDSGFTAEVYQNEFLPAGRPRGRRRRRR